MHVKMGEKFEILAFHHPVWRVFSPLSPNENKESSAALGASSGCSRYAALVIPGWVVEVESNAGVPGCVTGLLPAAPAV